MSIFDFSHMFACCCISKYRYDRYDEGTFAASLLSSVIIYAETKLLT
jgi:hypothetical protein